MEYIYFIVGVLVGMVVTLAVVGLMIREIRNEVNPERIDGD